MLIFWSLRSLKCLPVFKMYNLLTFVFHHLWEAQQKMCIRTVCVFMWDWEISMTDGHNCASWVGQIVSLLRWDFVDFWSFLKFLKKSLWHVALKRDKAGVRQTRTLPNSASYQFYWCSRHLPWPEPEFCLQNMNCPQPFPLICIPKLCTRMKTRGERLSKLYNN